MRRALGVTGRAACALALVGALAAPFATPVACALEAHVVHTLSSGASGIVGHETHGSQDPCDLMGGCAEGCLAAPLALLGSGAFLPEHPIEPAGSVAVVDFVSQTLRLTEPPPPRS